MRRLVQADDGRGAKLEQGGVVAFLVLMFWVVIWPWPYGLAMLLAGLAPWIGTALAIIYRRSVAPFSIADLDPRANLGALLGAGLFGGRVFYDVDFTPGGLGQLTLIGCGVAMALALVWLILSRPLFAKPRWLIVPIGLAILAGATSPAALNVALGNKQGELGQVQVTAKRVKEEKRSRRRARYRTFIYHQLTVTGLPGAAGAAEISVQPGFFQSVRVGEPLCYDLHRGILGADWYLLDHCPRPPRSSLPLL
ncbi:hypothetical protein DJ018_07795 [Phenylobacterium deserti]|uniref:Uncharacterized protein n=2 Tax=Phenylobacterium deserti TaxID=1914756 RepID=A0A328AYA7_9CAUL|nr:hypothetical protein DJ018_07795 [Phenylobacterium deserti]